MASFTSIDTRMTEFLDDRIKKLVLLGGDNLSRLGHSFASPSKLLLAAFCIGLTVE